VANAPDARHRRREGFGPLWLGSLGLVLLIAIPIASLLFTLSPATWLEQLGSPMARRALGLTLLTTAISTALCVVLGLPVAYLLARFDFRGRDTVATLLDLPLTVPPVVVGLALLLAFGRQGLVGRHLEAWGVQIAFTRVAVVLAQVAIASPFFVKAARAGFEAVDERLESAAWSLGAGRWRAFWTVAVPLALPSLLAGTVLAWGRALSEFGATMMFAGNFPGRTQTLSLAVMSAMESDLGTAVAIASISLALGVVALFGARALARRFGAPGF